MRAVIVGFLMVALFGCQRESASKEENQFLVSKEIFTTRVGASEVYGVQFKTTADEQVLKGFAVQLSQNDKVWADTLLLDLAPNDTVENELIFSEAVVGDDDFTELRIETFDIER